MAFVRRLQGVIRVNFSLWHALFYPQLSLLCGSSSSRGGNGSRHSKSLQEVSVLCVPRMPSFLLHVELIWIAQMSHHSLFASMLPKFSPQIWVHFLNLFISFFFCFIFSSPYQIYLLSMIVGIRKYLIWSFVLKRKKKVWYNFSWILIYHQMWVNQASSI